MFKTEFLRSASKVFQYVLNITVLFITYLLKEENKITGAFQSGLLEHWCENFFLTHAELITWLSALKGIISANLVCDENNNKFSSVILPSDRCISYRFLLI